ncbi:MAG: vitamin K epoxide reductase family protein [Thermodesulfobacteriota bacterium]
MQSSNSSASRTWSILRRARGCTGSEESASAPPPSGNPYFVGPWPLIALLVLALVGAFATAFLTYRHILLFSQTGGVPESALCRAQGAINCDAILLSEYAVVISYVPASSLGLMGFVFVLWCTVNALINQRMRKVAWIFLVLYFFTALGVSLYFLYLMAYEVDNVCPWCLVVHTVNFASVAILMVVAIRKREDFLLPEISSLAERIYFVAGGVLISLLTFFVSGMVEQALTVQDRTSKYEELIGNPVVTMALLKASPSVDVPISPDDPVFGDPKAPFPLIVFTDFACPACARHEHLFRQLVDRNKHELKLVYKTYPLSTDCNNFILTNLHPMGCQAARAAQAAYLLGGNQAFLAYAELLFKNQKLFSKSPWLDFASKLNLDRARFQELLKEGSPADRRLDKDVKQGQELNLAGTPLLVFENKRIPEQYLNLALPKVLEELVSANRPDGKGVRLKPPF